MRGAVVRAILAAVVFLAWLGYLAYLVVHRVPDGALLSRPQLLVSDVDLIVDIDDPEKDVLVVEALYPIDAERQPLPGTRVSIDNLRDCHRRKVRDGREVVVPDFTGPGRYLVPLRASGQGYAVVPTPPSPGYPDALGEPRPGAPRIYPATPETLAQYRSVRKP